MGYLSHESDKNSEEREAVADGGSQRKVASVCRKSSRYLAASLQDIPNWG